MSLSVYEFVDEIEEKDPNREYMRHSLAKDWGLWGKAQVKTKREKQWKMVWKKADNTTVERLITQKQFCEYYAALIKSKLPFLPQIQINDLTRKTWLKKKKNGIIACVGTKQKPQTPRSSLKSTNKLRRNFRPEKRVSFNLAENETTYESVDKRMKTKAKPRDKMLSRFVKPLDIDYASQESRTPRSPLKSTNRLRHSSTRFQSDIPYNSPERARQSRVSRSPDLMENLDYSSPLIDKSPPKVYSNLAINCPKIGSNDTNTEKLVGNDANNELNDINDQYVSPVINHLNSTKSLKNHKNITIKSKQRVLKNRTEDRFIYSKKKLFVSPVKQSSKECKASVPLKTKIKASVPIGVDGRWLGLRVRESTEDVMCDLFDRDHSQTDYDSFR